MLTKYQWIGVVAAVVVVFVIFGFDNIFNSLIWSDGEDHLPVSEELGGNTMSTDKAELQIIDVVVGTGAEAKAGSLVSVHYTGTFMNGIKFDSSVDRGAPIEFELGSGYVIKGWDQGLLGMKVGGKRKLVIPPGLAYGGDARGSIPPNSTLLFDVELMGVK